MTGPGRFPGPAGAAQVSLLCSSFHPDLRVSQCTGVITSWCLQCHRGSERDSNVPKVAVFKSRLVGSPPHFSLQSQYQSPGHPDGCLLGLWVQELDIERQPCRVLLCAGQQDHHRVAALRLPG